METILFDVRVLLCVAGNQEVEELLKEKVSIQQSLERLISLGDLAREELKRIKDAEKSLFSSRKDEGRRDEPDREGVL